jgi:hypothetical protein
MAQSPTDKSFTAKKAAVIGIGIVTAKRAINNLRSEYFATTGNEPLELAVNNVMKTIGYVGAIAIDGIAGAVMVGMDVALGAMTYQRNNRRENIKLAIDRELKGQRVNIASGSVYYD